jgi:Cu2+-exporting ATPase
MTDAAHCFHCSEQLRPDPISLDVAGQLQRFCCLGCANAARWIEAEGLGDYYTLRSRQGRKVDEAALDFSAWDRDEITAAHCRPCPDGRQIVLLADGMHCAACAWLIQSALAKNPGVAAVNANAINGRVELRWNPGKIRLSELCGQLARLGYRPFLSVNEQYDRQKRQERNRLLLKLGLAALVTTQTMMFSEALYLDTAREMSVATRDFFRWLTFLLCSPVVFYSGSEFIRGMLRELRFGKPGMDTLAASSILLAYFASLYQTLTGGDHIWFDASAMFVFFLLSARILERFARNTARSQVDQLARAQPQFAWRVSEGRRVQCPIGQIQAGDILFLPGGEPVPADGVLLDEMLEVDESLLTGEAELQTRHRGDRILAGSTLGPNAGEIRVSETGQQTRLSQILRLVAQAQNAKPAESVWAERLASRFVVIMFAVTVIAFAIWWQIDRDKAFPVALAVLVAACPCALSLAVPAAVSSAFDALARAGVLVLSPNALKKLAGIDHVVFDKTGTLTTGKPSLHGIHAFAPCTEAEALQLACSLEIGSKHPLAEAFTGKLGQQTVFDALGIIPGAGISGRLGETEYRLGKAAFAAPGSPDSGIWLSRNGQVLAQFLLHDPIKTDAGKDLSWLATANIHMHLLSGDSTDRVRGVADALHISSYRARATPELKLDYLRTLQQHGARVLMVGDGINDAPVLAQADVSMAMGSGAWLAQSNADILLMNSSLKQIKQVFSVSAHMQKLMRQNIRWAIAYNVIAVAIALSGVIHPGYASLGMAGSSLLVTMNALRIYRTAP